MNISVISKTKISNACFQLKTQRTTVPRDPTLSGPKAISVINGFNSLSRKLTNDFIRLDTGEGKPIILDLVFVMGGEGCDIWSVLMVGPKDEAPLLKAWFDSNGTAHIQTNYGNYTTSIKFASAEDVTQWIVSYLNHQS